MKKILLFITVMALAILCTATLASADSINDVVFTKGGNEVFTISAGDIAATVNVSVEAEKDAFLITSAYEGNRLANVQYESVKLLPAQKKYQGTPVTATAATTAVNAMLWDANYEPIGEMQSLTNVSREIKVTDFSVTADGKTYKAVVDNADKKITVEQIADMYSPNSTSKYPEDHAADYASIVDAPATFSLNGVQKNENVTLTTSTPDTITLTAANGRTLDYTVKLEQYILSINVNCDAKRAAYSTPVFDTATANRIGIKNLYSEPLTAGYYNGYFGGGNGIPFFFTCLTGGHDIQNYQDTSAESYFNISFADRSADNTCIKFIKQGNTGSGPAAHVVSTSDLGNAKAVFSFDFMCESLNTATALQPMVMGGGSIPLVQLNFEKKSGADAYYLTYASTAAPSEEGMGGYGKRLAEIPLNQWNNIKIIIDQKSDKPYIVCLNDEVLLQTSYKNSAAVIHPEYFNLGNIMRFGTYSSANTTSYLDNIEFYTINTK